MVYNGRIRPKCSIVNCNEPNFSKSYCDKHYRRWIRHGDPLYVNPKCNRERGHEWTKARARANTAKWKKENKKEYNASTISKKA